jgi:tRNA(Ile2) C34 agmatinyltransferase TiaS
MKTLEYVEEIDETLSRWEDYFHGQEGIDVTEARSKLDKIRKQLKLDLVIVLNGTLSCNCPVCGKEMTSQLVKHHHCTECKEHYTTT